MVECQPGMGKALGSIPSISGIHTHAKKTIIKQLEEGH